MDDLFDLGAIKKAASDGDFERAIRLADRIKNVTGSSDMDYVLYWLFRTQDFIEGSLVYTRLKLLDLSIWLGMGTYLLFNKRIQELFSLKIYTIGFYILLSLGILGALACIIRRWYEKASINGFVARAMQAIDDCINTDFDELDS